MANDLMVGDFLSAEVVDTGSGGIQLACRTLDGVRLRLRSRTEKLYRVGDIESFWVIDVDAKNNIATVSDSDFGRAAVSDRMRPRYVRAGRAVLGLLRDKILPEAESADQISEAKGLFTRCIKKNQWDWFTVWTLLKSPPLSDCLRASEVLGAIGKSLRICDAAKVQAELSRLPIGLDRRIESFVREIEAETPRVQNSRRSPSAPSDSAHEPDRPEPVKLVPFSYDKLEKANRTHRATVNTLMGYLQRAGYHPHEHDLIDVFCKLKDGPAIFEIKSLSAKNEMKQSRAAFSQLAYYRYVTAQENEAMKHATLWVVFSAKPQDPMIPGWFAHEGINALWLEDGTLVGERVPD